MNKKSHKKFVSPINFKYKKFEITSDQTCFHLKTKKNTYYYADFESLLRAIPNRIILKKELNDIETFRNEMRDIRIFIEDVIKKDNFKFTPKDLQCQSEN